MPGIAIVSHLIHNDSHDSPSDFARLLSWLQPKGFSRRERPEEDQEILVWHCGWWRMALFSPGPSYHGVIDLGSAGRVRFQNSKWWLPMPPAELLRDEPLEEFLVRISCITDKILEICGED